MPLTPPTIVGSGATSRYANQADLERRFGATNIAEWSHLDGESGAADSVRVQGALDYACNYIDQFFNSGPYAIPLQLGSVGQSVVREWAVIIAGVDYLFSNRGQKQEDSAPNQYSAMLDLVKTEMRRYLTGNPNNLDAATANSAQASAPTFA